jgi:hypothetical protein
MDKQKQKREHSRRLDALVVGCAIGSGCDEAEWVRLAIEYAHEFRCPYALSSVHMRSLETSAEQDAAKQMEAKVNKVIAKTIRREGPVGAMSREIMHRLTMQPGPTPRTIMYACKCRGSRQSPNCKMPPALCRAATHALSSTVPRSPSSPRPKTPSPKTKKHSPKHDNKHGGKNKNKSKSKRRKPQ